MLKRSFAEVNRLGYHLLPIIPAMFIALVLCRACDKSSHELVMSAVSTEGRGLVALVNRV